MSRMGETYEALPDATGDEAHALRAALAARDELLAVVAHELRAPLGAIVGWAHLLRDCANEQDFERGLEVIEQAAQVQARLIEDLLDMGRVSSGNLRLDRQRVHPRDVVDAAVDAARPDAASRHIALRSRFDVGVGPVLGDATRLQQVVANLLQNALKFTPENGEVVVAVGHEGPHAVIRVCDNGPGIPAPLLAQVFEPWRQGFAAQGQGLGLGLAIARTLVQMHGGSIRADSAGEGRGACFTVRLPLALDGGDAQA
ncbi:MULTISPECIES: HAMP domain-containing sensor histidine kinase [Ramlibacter]|uniref:histidine kinase n=1 Tax=Ramlibacter aquaticus TaxID=2780094 RepID=A0ABR9SF16_9BURK|nr:MULTISPECIES: HAMP domain-containing sensor histidine kinase [Ramlibacter]MBE7940933.1 HAMP domain-containing histidine kinase [Ramlibacter aquaticus]